MKSGLLVIEKPVGPTSHDLVAIVRRGTGVRRVGHAGTLDPLASGVMVLALGQSTRLLEYFTAHDKRYRADIILGIETDTCDSEGEVLASLPVPETITKEVIEKVLDEFRGEIYQVPPSYSARKVGGKKAYELARKGQQVDLAARAVVIHSLTLLSCELPRLVIEVACSAGTYIRSLARDIGRRLGPGGSLAALVREASGSFTLDSCITLADLQSAFRDDAWQRFLINPADHLPGWQKIPLNEAEIADIRAGRAVAYSSPRGAALALGADEEVIAVLLADEEAGLWRPHKVFADGAGH